MNVKSSRNITILRATKIVECSMKDSNNIYVIKKVSLENSSNLTSTNNPRNQLDKDRTLIQKFMKLGPNDWRKFQKQLKKLHSAEIC